MRHLEFLKSLANHHQSVLRRSALAIGILLGSCLAAALLIPQISGLPYNVREVFGHVSPLASALLLTGTLLCLALPPVLIAHWLILKPAAGAWVVFPWVTVQGILSWLFLRKAVPAESLHDILGTPILGWSGEWELLLRFLGLMASPALIATAMAIMARPAADRRGHALIALFPALLVAALLWHYVVVVQSATDNITELLTGKGAWTASLQLGAWFAVLSATGSYTSRSIAAGSGHPIVSAAGVILVSIPIGYALVLWATEAHVYKYGKNFSALQFLLSPNRDNFLSGALLFGAYTLAHISAVVVGALAQYPAWCALFSSVKPIFSIAAKPISSSSRLVWRLVWIYVILLVYGTLFPWRGWQPAHLSDLKNIWTWPDHVSLSDVLTNVLVYLPLGALLGIALRRTVALKVLLAATAGLLLSMTLESLQILVPARTPSGLDILLNTIGCAGGALLISFISAGPQAMQWYAWRNARFYPGRAADVGLMAAGIWLLAAASPLVPSFDLGELHQGIAPLWNTLAGYSSFDWGACLAYGLSITAFGLLLRSLTRPQQPVALLFIMLAIGVTLAAVPLAGRVLTLEMVIGLVVGIAAVQLPRKPSATKVALVVMLAYVVNQLHPVNSISASHPGVNWLPFALHLNHPERLLQSLEQVWPFVALAYLAAVTYPTNARTVIPVGGALVTVVAAGVEWAQIGLPGRYPDITDVLLVSSGWSLPWLYLTVSLSEVKHNDVFLPGRFGVNIRKSQLTVGIITLLVAGGIILTISLQTSHAPAIGFSEPHLSGLPKPEDLPAIKLPSFRITHPRLPSPSIADLAALQRDGRQFLRMHQRFARQKYGKLDSKILMAYMNLEAVDLAILHHELMALEFSGRGNVAAKPLALAYDWLYYQWTEPQRQALRDKLAEAGNYLIHGIREKDRLSAYNVYLYNSPFQALMAVSLVLYQDDPRGEPIMRFTDDLWKNRVLPVWRQIMGQSGGWHEGGEYVGLGIGQAVYQVPAMWREATGEDLFVTEPELRGFLDFLVYRTRPDGTHFRWGDAGFFDRDAPDRLPLAIKYRHAAAYTLDPPKRKQLAPTAWPWGPLSDDSLIDSAASAQLPWAKLFDGLGLVVARSDWSSQATYVTFKAGDNYWSHSHLDQGAFTIYRGGALAIDSGLYGPGYGADHHMNYTYQTIAHNVVTVTDPDDTAPAPPLKKDDPPRPIANDGGQRRVGSGWGLGQAPVDLAEWRANSEIYHTGKIEKSVIRDDVLVIAADMTPAYTNRYSGPGEFSHRTRRVERFWRTFLYDRVDDVIIVFDQVTATRADFLKRWLLHSQNIPFIKGNQFELEVPVEERAGRQGGRLTGYVLLPREVHIQTIGGPGFEFFVDGRNYDEGGGVAELHVRKPDTEPGAWRIEAIPANDALEHCFLVVLLPTDRGTPPAHRVRLIDAEGGIGVEVSGPRRLAHWRFEPGSQHGRVDIRSTNANAANMESFAW